MKIIIDLESNDSRQEYVDLSEYGITDKQWEAMSEEEQKDWLYENVVSQVDEASWYIEHFETE